MNQIVPIILQRAGRVNAPRLSETGIIFLVVLKADGTFLPQYSLPPPCFLQLTLKSVKIESKIRAQRVYAMRHSEKAMLSETGIKKRKQPRLLLQALHSARDAATHGWCEKCCQRRHLDAVRDWRRCCQRQAP